jgi:hypothetical protein
LDDPNGTALRTTSKERKHPARRAKQRAGVNDIWEENTMRRIPRTIKAMLAIVALLATTSLGVAAALASADTSAKATSTRDGSGRVLHCCGAGTQ